MIYLRSMQRCLSLQIRPYKMSPFGRPFFMARSVYFKYKYKKEVNMMDKQITELVFILDRSGSMAGLESDTIGGFNSMVEKQKKVEGEVMVSTVLFDHNFKVLHNRLPLDTIQPLTNADYYARGTTALLDAIGRSIQKIQHKHDKLPKADKPSKVMFVIITDGMENASREFRYPQIKRMIQQLTEKQAWEFIFLGANIDAMDVGQRFGMREDRVANYHADREGTNLNYEVISDAVTQYRTSKTIKDNWKTRIDQDYKSRNNKNKA